MRARERVLRGSSPVTQYQGREPSIWDACKRIFQPSESSPLNATQQETVADANVAREAIDVCYQLSNPRVYNMPNACALRATWKGREEEYLYARFAAALGWRSHADAKAFYKKHKGGYWGTL